MIKFIIYLLESSALLAIFYLLYVAVMKKETFFQLNRFFLLGIVVFSLLFPLVSFDFGQGQLADVASPVEEFSKFRMSYYESLSKWGTENYSNSGIQVGSNVSDKVPEIIVFDWMGLLVKLAIAIYAIGVIIFLLKFSLTTRRLVKMIKTLPQEEFCEVKVVKVPNPIGPFSFLKYVFVHQETMNTPEFDQIVAHEKTHIEQYHSIDLLFVQFVAAFLWFNPLIWKLIKSLKTIHEYIADKKIISVGYCLDEYQELLLRQLISNNSYELVNNFNLSFIKKRITMMKNNQSGFRGKVRVTLSIICAATLSLVIVQCNPKVEKKMYTESEVNDILRMFVATSPDTISPMPVFTISDDQLIVDGTPREIEEIAALVEKEPAHGLIYLKIDRNQRMKKVREVQMELRRLNKRKVLYEGQTASGKQIIQPFLFAPLHWAIPKGDALAPQIDFSNASIDGNIATLNGVEYLNINLSQKANVDYPEEVYNFVYSHVKKGSLAYVIKAEFDETDVFENYLTNLAGVFQGFEKVYQEHAKKTYGKDFEQLKIPERIEVSSASPKAVFIAES